jgi:hypothetical protein
VESPPCLTGVVGVGVIVVVLVVEVQWHEASLSVVVVVFGLSLAGLSCLQEALLRRLGGRGHITYIRQHIKYTQHTEGHSEAE